MDKRHILREIKRTADANGGKPLGQRSFGKETGIKEKDWRARYWARWGDALREAGYEPNQSREPSVASDLIESLLPVIRRFGRFPSWAELVMERRADPAFPSTKTLNKRLGTHEETVRAVVEYCDAHPDNDDVLAACLPEMERIGLQSGSDEDPGVRDGSVYLIKSGRHYKVGRAFAMGRRGREIALQLPERAVTVHVIQTDDPIGIEAYWHRRFEDKRKNGEWFELTDSDVRAFRRRKTFM
jgi:hypothetical protein